MLRSESIRLALLLAFPLVGEIAAPQSTSAGSGWLPQGTAALVAPNEQIGRSLVSDGAGGVIIVIQDARKGKYLYDVYAQRLTADGNIASGWPVEGVPVCASAGQQFSPRGISDEQGGVICVWNDSAVRLQRLDASGSALWAPNGIRASSVVSLQGYTDIVTDGAGGVVVVWEDARAGWRTPRPPMREPLYYPDLYAQRIGPDGTLMWGVSGVPVCTDSTGQYAARILPDNDGIFLVLWHDDRGGVWMQRLGSSGQALLATDGVFVTGEYLGPIVMDGSGGFVSAFGRPGTGLAVQRFGASGEPLWSSTGVDLVGVTSATSEADPELAPDGTGGVIVTWHDLRNQLDWDVYAQRVDGSGRIATGWPADGLPISSLPQFQVYPQIVGDGTGGAYMAWIDYRDDAHFPDAYATHVTASGAIVEGWPHNGRLLADAPGQQIFPLLLPHTDGGVIVAWSDYRAFADVFAQRFSAHGVIGGDEQTAAQLALVRADARTGSVHLEWFAGESGGIGAVEKVDGTGSWRPIASVDPDGAGLYVYEDSDVVGGRRYGYRLFLEAEGRRSDEVWIDVPVTVEFALEGFRPNPAKWDATVSLSLPDDAPALLELFDVQGRSLLHRTLGSLGSGRHLVRLERRDLEAGVYLLRLTQGQRSKAVRACVLP